MPDNLEILQIKLENIEHEIEGALSHKKWIEKEIMKHSKYKIKEKCFTYFDSYGDNNPHWCECQIQKIYYIVDAFIYAAYITNPNHEIDLFRFNENELHREKPKERI